jgi:hypothetical protein
MILALTILLVITSIVTTTVLSALRHRRESRWERQLLQATYLCDAGAARFANTLASEPTKRDASWSMSLGEETCEIECQFLAEPSCLQIRTSLVSADGSQVQRTKTYPYQKRTNALESP